MSEQEGAYGESDATHIGNRNRAAIEQEHGDRSEQPDTDGAGGQDSFAGTDQSLNARVKIPPRRFGGPWLWGVLAVAVALALVMALVVHRTGRLKSAAQDGKAQTVSVGLKLAPSNLDIRNQSGTVLDQLLIGNVYEGLVFRGADNKVIPALAQRWDVREDGRLYIFHLHRNTVFSDGHHLNAEDAVWSINELVNKNYHDAQLLKNFQSITASDDHTVELRLTAPYSDLLWVLSGRPGLVFEKGASYDPKTQAVGSGPYEVSKFVANDSVTLKTNPHYWGARKARTPTVVIRYFADDNAAINALRSHDVQVLAPITANLAGPFLKDKYHYRVKVGEGTDKYVLAFNSKGPRTSDSRVRQAIRYAIDHQELIASRGGTDKALGGPIASLDPGYQDLTGIYPHDVKKAKALMAQAGFSTSKPLDMQLTYANIYGSELGDQLRSQLRAIGIDLKVNMVEFPVWLQDVHKNHEFDLSLVDQNDSHDFYQWANPDYYYGYDNKEVQELFNRAMTADNAKESEHFLAQAARRVSQDAPADWLFNYRVTTAMLKGVQGFPLNLNQVLMPLSDLTYQPERS